MLANGLMALLAITISINVYADNELNSSSSQSQQYPVFLNIIRKLSANGTTTTATATLSTTTATAAISMPSPSKNILQMTEVPSFRNASLEFNNSNNNITVYTIQQQLQQTPASVFFANYNNQQNVLQLVKNIDIRLRNIRNVEMRVTKIQEIFDSIQFGSSSSSSSTSSSATQMRKSNEQQQQRNQQTAQLQTFSKRLTKKLQKATFIVLELSDFMRLNITKVLTQQHIYNDDFNLDDDEDIDDDSSSSSDDNENVEHKMEFDNDLNHVYGLDSSSAMSQQLARMHLYLNTHIESCQPQTLPTNYDSDVHTTTGYNSQQVEILNYLKGIDSLDETTALLNENNARSLAANTQIANKLTELRQRLTQTDVFEMPKDGVGHNGKLKFLGNHYKHIYFLSRSDGAVDEHARYTTAHFRQLYVASIKQKFVLLLIDVGAALNAELLELTKSFVSNILQLLTSTDSIAIITIASEAELMYLDDAAHGIYNATRTRKEEIMNYINNLSIARGVQTNHTHGFEYAFEVLAQLQNASLISAKQPIEFVYITRGLLTNLSDAMHVLKVVAEGQARLQTPIVINTCAVVLDEKRIMYEQQFLCDIATQNYTKYDIDVSAWLPKVQQQQQRVGGKCFVLTIKQQENLLRTSTRIFEPLFEERYLTDGLDVHTPVVEAEHGDVIVSITHAVPPYGIVGINLYLADLIEDVLNYQPSNKQQYNYAFLIERNTGYTLAHPAFPRPSTQQQTAYPVDIAYLENATDFTSIRQQLLTLESGQVSATVYVSNNKRSVTRLQRTYQWQSVLDIYVLCIVATHKSPQEQSPDTSATNSNDYKTPMQLHGNMPLTISRYTTKDNMAQFVHGTFEFNAPAMDLLYHRLDLLPPIPLVSSTYVKTCRYFRQLATLDAPTLFLSAAAFESPFTFLHNNKLSTQYTQQRTLETIMAYLKDSTGLLANPGLRPQIRNEVNALYNAMLHLKKRHQDPRGTLRNHIIRRYIATVSGVLQVYPGCLLSSNYDATRRPWFNKAMQQPGKIITTEPYLDAAGAGYIVTIAHTIFEGKAHALHSFEHDQPVAIVALDLPYAFYYKLILETTPVCQMPSIKCLLFENEGYLIAHPSMLEPSTTLQNPRRPHEHLTHKESYLANDILNHKALVRKLGCSNYQNRTLQRYYVFNTSLSEILTNVVHGERTKYAISLVRGSNIFAAVLNSTCDGGAFCPCSTIDRVCLNCKRMDQTDCECPCECPMELDVEQGYSNYTRQFPYCAPPAEHFIALPPSMDSVNQLPSCLSINCEIYATQSECLAVMGCEWCQQDLDGNAFSAAFCTTQATCFNGVLASFTPYGDLDDLELIAAHGYNPQQKQNSYSAFGPVGGAIIVLVIVIGFAIYCYRHNLDTHAQDQFYIDSMQEENYGLPLSRFNFDDCQAHDEPPGNGGGNGYDHNAAQRNLIHPADISPYHVSTGSSYRRPPNGESDHGYSTMTPHEDSSDHQCFTLAEPLLLHDKRNSKSDTMSISTSISSPTNRQQQQQMHPYLGTQLPPPSVSKVDAAARYVTPIKKQHNTTLHSPARTCGEMTMLPADELPAIASHYILAPVTVHRHMETSES